MRPDKNTKELLLRVAVNLFSQKGYLDTSIRDMITRENATSYLFK